MHTNKFNATATLRRSLMAFVLLALTWAVAACKSYVFLPVEVAYEKLSPPYVVQFVNLTGTPFDVLPTKTGVDVLQPKVTVPPGGTFSAILQLRRIRVGAGSVVRGAQVVDSPFFEQAGADRAEVRFVQGDPHSLLIALQHESWFTPYERHDAVPVTLVVPLKDFPPAPLFPRGPEAEP